jgi:hypothetical protein
MKTLTSSLFVAAVLALSACAADEPATTEADPAAVTQICTPFEETCDFSCFAQGGPSSNDCIVKCDFTGTSWKTVRDCGWAQNGQTSSSCLIAQPHPLCQNN